MPEIVRTDNRQTKAGKAQNKTGKVTEGSWRGPRRATLNCGIHKDALSREATRRFKKTSPSHCGRMLRKTTRADSGTQGAGEGGNPGNKDGVG